MAGVKISDLNSSNTFTGNEQIPLVQGNETKKATLASFVNFLSGDLLADSELKALSSDWQNTYTQVKSCSGGWQTGGGLSTVVTTCSGKWESVYSHVKSCSGNYAETNKQNTFISTQVFEGNVEVRGGNITSGIYSINDGVNSAIIGGNSNTIGENAGGSTILGGDTNQISRDILNSSIIGGQSNDVINISDYSTIIGGSNNTIENNSDRSGIFGGQNNIINGLNDAFIIGTGITATKGNAVHMNEAVVFGAISAQGVISALNGNSNQWNNVYSHVKSCSGEWIGGAGDGEKATSVYSQVNSCSGEWDSVYTQVGTCSSVWKTTAAITSDVEMGGITIGETINADTTLQDFITALLSKTYYPTFIAPSYALSYDANTEVGESLTVTGTFNKGCIKGDLAGSTWDSNACQNPRAGAATKYCFGATDNGTNSSYVITNLPPSTTLTTVLCYDVGCQPKDSKNNNYCTPLPAGSITCNYNITGKRKTFWASTPATLPTNTSADIRNFECSCLGLVKGSKFCINIQSGDGFVAFAYPKLLNSVTKVCDTVFGTNYTSLFDSKTVDVCGANNQQGTSYCVYYYDATGTYEADITYEVTI